MRLALARQVATQGCDLLNEKLLSHNRDGVYGFSSEMKSKQLVALIGWEPRSIVTFRDASGTESLALKSLFQHECIKRIILFTGSHNIFHSHAAANIDLTLQAYRTATVQAIKNDDAS